MYEVNLKVLVTEAVMKQAREVIVKAKVLLVQVITAKVLVIAMQLHRKVITVKAKAEVLFMSMRILVKIWSNQGPQVTTAMMHQHRGLTVSIKVRVVVQVTTATMMFQEPRGLTVKAKLAALKLTQEGVKLKASRVTQVTIAMIYQEPPGVPAMQVPLLDNLEHQEAMVLILGTREDLCSLVLVVADIVGHQVVHREVLCGRVLAVAEIVGYPETQKRQ